tara:strand:+ start:25520 stop:26071 length:552 start_codon:yes stop_codon:yes gene_type:complete
VPILVVGPGRCGSSLVAGVLHKLGVSMGRTFVPANDTNIWGHWEDRDFHTLHKALFFGEISTRQFLTGARALIADRIEPWGIKDPRLCRLVTIYLALFEYPTIIRCTRARDEIIDSMRRAYGWPAGYAAQMIDARDQMLDAHLGGYSVITVDFADRASLVDTLCAALHLTPTANARAHVHHLR